MTNDSETLSRSDFSLPVSESGMIGPTPVMSAGYPIRPGGSVCLEVQ
jgi:hypothetical protein